MRKNVLNFNQNKCSLNTEIDQGQNNKSITSMGVREGILLGGAENICPENNNLP